MILKTTRDFAYGAWLVAGSCGIIILIFLGLLLWLGAASARLDQIMGFMIVWFVVVGLIFLLAIAAFFAGIGLSAIGFATSRDWMLLVPPVAYIAHLAILLLSAGYVNHLYFSDRRLPLSPTDWLVLILGLAPFPFTNLLAILVSARWFAVGRKRETQANG